MPTDSHVDFGNPPAAVTVNLVAPHPVDHSIEWDNPLIEANSGVWRLTGAAGTGKTTLLLDVVAKQIANGIKPENILVVTASKQAAARLRQGLVDRVVGQQFHSNGAVVRSIHSLAFALLRQRKGEQLRLITGAEQDAVIRELLKGHQESGGMMWPEETREAIGMVGFARGLRDFLLRAVERGQSPEDLEDLGQRYQRPMWVAAGQFLREYEQTMALGGSHSLSAAELLSMVVEQPLPETQFDVVIIDDAQHFDPKAAELLGELIARARFAVIAGDAEQSVFRFRGARPTFLKTFPCDQELKLTDKHRIDIHPGAPGVSLYEAATPGEMFEAIADKLRRARLIDGVPWSQLAVVVRSVGMIAPMHRALLAAGVPVHIDPTDTVLNQQRIVAALILAVRAVRGQITPAELEELALGPIGGADAVTLRRLLRALRKVELQRTGAMFDAFQSQSMRSALEVLQELVFSTQLDPDLWEEVQQVLTERELDILLRLRSVIVAGRNGSGVEDTLWEIWAATGLSDRLLAASLRGGAAGSQADRDLDSVMALFDAAGDWVERRPQSTIDSFIAHLREQELPTGVRDRRLQAPDSVSILTAHATSGMQWHTVVVAGVQEDSWPALNETGSLFGQEELVDLLDDGITPGTLVSRLSERLQEERRLFFLACSRAESELLITTVNAPDADEVLEPSRFLRAYRGLPDDDDGEEPEESTDATPADLLELLDSYNASIELEQASDILPLTRLLSVPAIVAELRRAVLAESTTEKIRNQAARQLARLAHAGVPGADPSQWWGMEGRSEQELLPVKQLSPSRIEAGLNCPLRATLQQVLTDEDTPIQLLRGTLLHAFAEAVALGVDSSQAEQEVIKAYAELLTGPEWFKATELANWQQAIAKTAKWLADSRGAFTQVGVETEARVTVARGNELEPQGVRLVGRIDRLEQTAAGDYHIVDLKSGKNKPSKDNTSEHIQLKAYQLALKRGKLQGNQIITDPTGAGMPVDGASLVYPEYSSANITAVQAALDDQQLAEFEELLPPLLHQLRGPRLKASINDGCRSCALHSVCPVQDAGRWTTEATK